MGTRDGLILEESVTFHRQLNEKINYMNIISIEHNFDLYL